MKFLISNFRFPNKKGIITVYVLVFGAVFLILLGGLIGFISLQLKISKQKVAWADSLNIAEAGINYYRWHLNHTPEGQNPDIQDGNDWCCKVGGVEYGQDDPQCQTGGFTVCGVCDGNACYEHSYYDAEGKLKGKFVLKIKAKKICGRILGVYVDSIGSTEEYPDTEREVQVKFAATSIAEYAYIINDGVWAGSDREIFGKYHSNSGIRMDGTHNSLVTSAANEWVCTSAFGCCGDDATCDCDWSSSLGCHRVGGPFNPCIGRCAARDVPQECVWDDANDEVICDGVCGGGGPKDLWKNPVPPFDFSGITADLSEMKNLATSTGIYYPPSDIINSSAKGYHLVFNSDGSFDVFVITDLDAVYACDKDGDGVCEGDDDWYWSEEKISSEYQPPDGVYGGYDLKFDNVTTTENCGLIFIEDNLWIEGTVKGKKTVAVANLETPGVDPSVFLNNNLDYTTLDGSDSLAVIAEKDILLPCHTPDTMVARGVFVAQWGNFGRKFYIDPDVYLWHCWWHPSECCDDGLRTHLTVYGSIVSNGRVGTRWGSSSGYMERDNYFDAKLSKDPPPLLPYVSEEMEIISWEEIE
ncbi:MAG: hypothetical protein J7K33_04265 [Candidatus Marinimicrobia bacterium]|nr:hypothetical protein [Candidatus Neomarinimicrobiota bacterium]